MFGPIRRDPDQLDVAIKEALSYLVTSEPDDEEYEELLRKIERLYALKALGKKRASPDTMWLVAGNLLGILVIVAYEQRHVFVSRAQAFLLKTR